MNCVLREVPKITHKKYKFLYHGGFNRSSATMTLRCSQPDVQEQLHQSRCWLEQHVHVVWFIHSSARYFLSPLNSVIMGQVWESYGNDEERSEIDCNVSSTYKFTWSRCNKVKQRKYELGCWQKTAPEIDTVLKKSLKRLHCTVVWFCSKSVIRAVLEPSGRNQQDYMWVPLFVQASSPGFHRKRMDYL